jgi:peroxiredoxin
MRSLAAVSIATLLCTIVACDGGGSDASSQQHELIGKPAPSFSLNSANGRGKVALASLKGKVVIVDFWATWCGPCKESFPKLQELYTKYQASGVELVGLSEDDKNEGIAEFGQAHGSVKFPIGWDPEKGIAGQYKPPTMPTSFIIDKNGIVRFAHVGYHDNDQAEIEKELKTLM